MNKLILPLLLISVFATSTRYDGNSTAPVVLAGSIVKNIGNEPIKKYPRKNCPVCKGTGKYLSGDGIKMVDCGYCSPESKTASSNPQCNCVECVCQNCVCNLRINKL